MSNPNPDPKSANLEQISIGKVNNLVKSVSWEEKDSGGPKSEEPHENSSSKDQKNHTLRTLSDDSSQNNLSKSEEFLAQISSKLKRNSSDSRLSDQELRNGQWRYSDLLKHESEMVNEKSMTDSNLEEDAKDAPVEDSKLVQSETENVQKETENRLSESSDTELEEVELRKPRSLSIRRVISRSVRGSIRLVKGMRPKSESEAANKEKSASNEKCKLLKQVVTAVLESTQPPSTLFLQLPAPLVVEDPPSTDDEGLHELRNQNAVILNGSSGNFGSAGPRSAPATPQGQLGAPQGGQPEALVSPSIQRSPSHSVFSKTDKLSYKAEKPKTSVYTQRKAVSEDEEDSSSTGSNDSMERTNLKHLSTSTPTMTAQGQLAEPPSPKATKDPKVHTTSKARQKKFLRHFPNVEEDEKVLNHYSCALIGDILLQGHLYITKNYFAFYSNVFGYVTKLLIPILTVEEITKEKTARIIPNAVGITTSEDKHIFGSLMSRDSTLAYMKTVWEKAKSEETLPEPEITEPDQDSSESGESDRESPALESIPSGPDILASAKFDRMRKESIRNQTEGSLLERKGSKGFVRTLKDAIAEFRKLPRQSLILVATTLLLILLFLSAGVLLYRIHKIQNKYSISLQGASLSSTSEDIYSDLLHWQTHLHSKSADAVNNFLDNNLDQIAKVRQSLEALSALLAGQNTNAVPPTKVDSTDLKTESVTVNPAAGNS